MVTNSNSEFSPGTNLNQLSLLTALAIAMLTFLILLLLIALHILKIDISLPFLLFPIQLIISFVLMRWALLQYVRRRLKALYKLINTGGGLNNIENDKGIDSTALFDLAEKDVENWLRKKNDEQVAMIEMENYRREYLGNVSHELKTPIFNLQGFIQTLIHGGIQDNEVNMRFLNKALSNAERLQTIVEDLEAISKLESGQHGAEMIPFDIRTLSQEIFEDLSTRADEKNIKLTYKSDETHAMIVLGDRDQIRLAITNLVQNAIKYGRESGFVKIRTYDADGRILIEVADNGIGIPEESLPKVFERFYRVDKGRSRDMGGSGLGLSIVRHIIENHGQTIAVRSKVGEGSVFSFTLESATNG